MFKLLIVTLLIRWPLLLATKYELEFQNDNIFTPCKDFPDNFLNKFVIITGNRTQLADGNIYINGDVVLTYDFQSNVKYPFLVEIFKRQRGEWQTTIYTIRRGDLCTDFFNPLELWHRFVNGIPKEQRICPFKKGQTFNLDFVTDTKIELVAPNLEGDYLGRIQVGTNAQTDKSFLCAEAYYTLYRI